MTPSEYARHRGCSPAAVTLAMKERIAGAIVMRGSKRMLDRDKADHLWNSRGARPPKSLVSSGRGEEPGRLPTPEQVRAAVSGMPEDEIPGLDVSRERKEHYQAEIARLSALKERGELVPAAEVQKTAFALGRMIRDSLQVIPDRVAAQVAATKDVREVHRLLSDEIAVALRGLANG